MYEYGSVKAAKNDDTFEHANGANFAQAFQCFN